MSDPVENTEYQFFHVASHDIVLIKILHTLTLSSKATTNGSSVSMTRFLTSLLDRGGPPSSSVYNTNIYYITYKQKISLKQFCFQAIYSMNHVGGITLNLCY